MRQKIVFATNNLHKINEVQVLLKHVVDISSLKDINCMTDIPETGSTLTENALIKARYVKEHFGYDCFADDSGLEVAALNGAPGVFSARYGGEAHNSEKNMNRLLRELEGLQTREAQFRTVIALIWEGQEYLFEGVVNGIIAPEKRGDAGFGYDPIFIPQGYTETFAQLGEEIKNKISHRAIAVAKLSDFLRRQCFSQ